MPVFEERKTSIEVSNKKGENTFVEAARQFSKAFSIRPHFTKQVKAIY